MQQGTKPGRGVLLHVWDVGMDVLGHRRLRAIQVLTHQVHRFSVLPGWSLGVA